jgi:hypothetical protein
VTIKEIALGLVEDPDYQNSLKKRMLNGRSPQLEILMHFYAYGKPKTEIATDKTIRVIIQRDGTGPSTVIDAQPAIEHHETPDNRNGF